MNKGFIHDLAETLPQRQANAEKRYKAEQEAFYAELESKGINTSSKNLPEPEKTQLIVILARQMNPIKKRKKRRIA